MLSEHCNSTEFYQVSSISKAGRHPHVINVHFIYVSGEKNTRILGHKNLRQVKDTVTDQ